MSYTVELLIYRIGWDGLTALSTFALAATAIIAASYARTQVNDFRREAKIKHLIDLVDQFEREPWATRRRQLGVTRTADGKLTELDMDAPPEELHDILNFFEHMGYLLDGGYLDLAGVSVEFHFWIFNFWADAELLVKHEQSESPVFYEYLEKMVSRLVELERKRFPGFRLPPRSMSWIFTRVKRICQQIAQSLGKNANENGCRLDLRTNRGSVPRNSANAPRFSARPLWARTENACTLTAAISRAFTSLPLSTRGASSLGKPLYRTLRTRVTRR